MSMQITMTQTRMGEAGSLLVSGSTYTVSDAFGAAMVGAKYATDTNGALTPAPSALTVPEVAAARSLVSAYGISDPAVRPARGYVVAADLRAANVAATAGSPTITDVERIAPDGTKMRGVRMTSTGAGTNCSFDINIRSQTFSTGRITALVYTDHTATGLDVSPSLYVGDSSGLTNNYVTNGQNQQHRGWQVLSPGLASGNSFTKWIVTGTATWGTTNFIRVRVRIDYTTATLPWIEVYEIDYNEDTTPWIAITADDGYDSVYSIGAPALERYGMRGSFAIIADLIGTAGYMTLANLLDLQDRGHEMVVHGPIGGTGSLVNYISSTSRLAAVTTDVKFHRDYLVNNGLNKRGSANVYVFPQGYDRFAAGNEDIHDALASQGFVGGRRSALSRQVKRTLRGGNPWVFNPIGHTWTSAPSEAANIVAITASINSAATEKYDAVLMFHKFVAGSSANALEIGLSDLETLLTAIADNRAAGTQDQVLFSRMVYSMAGLQRPLA
jgi:hypothetical protein